MNLSDLPPLVAIPFANSAGGSYIRPVPVPSQIGVTAGAASFTDGFTPDTFTSLSGGGAYVSGGDVNGILNHVTKWTRWVSAGGPAVYDPTFAASLGGYPKGAVVASTAMNGVEWFNTVDGNMTNPDGGSSVGWVVAGAASATLAQAEAATAGNVFLSPLVLKELFNSVDAQSIYLPNGRIVKLGATVLPTPNTNTVSTPVVFNTPFPSEFDGFLACGNKGPNPDWGGLSLKGQNFTIAGGTLAGDTGNAEYGFNQAVTAYWIAWGK
jgi:hypothetical protein